MIFKTSTTFKRRCKSWRGSKVYASETHTEKYHRETWWLFGLIPLYARNSIVVNTL